MKKTPVEVFSDWAKVGKDFGMQQGHKNSVEKMLQFATKGLKKFSFIAVSYTHLRAHET